MKHFIRGGQLLQHHWRMFLQLWRLLTVVFFIVAGLSMLLYLNHQIEHKAYYWGILKTSLLADVVSLFNDAAVVSVNDMSGHEHRYLAVEFSQQPFVKSNMADLKRSIGWGGVFSLTMGFVILMGVVIFLAKRGATQSQPQFIRGASLTDPEGLRRQLMQAKQASDIALAGVPLLKNSEVQHILIHGTVGSGKSTGFMNLMDGVRTRGERLTEKRKRRERAVVYDKGCQFLPYFYRPGKDYILNPLDGRTESWNVWAECHDGADFDAQAEALMPMPSLNSVDPFWIHAARTIFVATAQELKHHPDRSNELLLRHLFTADLEQLGELLKGTEAESLVNKDITKTALNVKSVLANYLKSLKYLKDSATPFSIRDWVAQEDDDSWLFITSLGNKHATLRPLISAWLNTVANALLSLDDDLDRRLWVFLDELPSLHKLPYLIQAFAETRSFGGCFVAGMQSYGQLQDIYGFNGAKVINSLCNTRLFLRSIGEDNAWVSKNLGNYEVEEHMEGLSYGAHSHRDGVNISKQRFVRPLVMDSEIEFLNDLEGYLKLKGHWPVAKVKLHYQPREKLNEHFIARQFNKNGLNWKVEQIMNDCANTDTPFNRATVREDTEGARLAEKVLSEQGAVNSQKPLKENIYYWE